MHIHLFAGISGILTSVFILALVHLLITSRTKGRAFLFGPGGENTRFEPILARYVRLAEFTIGLATGGIVLIVGSSALHQAGQLPWQLASPLLLISACVVYGLTFIALINFTYEGALHGADYTRGQYIANQTFGFSSLACFIVGYVWLVVAATH